MNTKKIVHPVRLTLNCSKKECSNCVWIVMCKKCKEIEVIEKTSKQEADNG